MNKLVINYINTEKELSQYNILVLSRGEQTPARKRLIEIEREFLSIPFDKMGLKTVENIAEAIKLYRQSRRLFYIKYDIKTSMEITAKVSKKLFFLDKLSAKLTTKRIQEINSVQDEDFHKELVSYFSDKKKKSLSESKSILGNKSLKELQLIEPAIIGKKRARLQIILFSLGKYIQKFLDEDLDLEKESNFDFNLINSKIDSFVFNLEKFSFDLYNSSLKEVPDKIASTMGSNKYIDRIYSLDNIFTLYKDTRTHTCVHTMGKKREVCLDSPKLGNVYLGYKNPIYNSFQRDSDRQTKTKVYGIIFPIERVSREKMTPLHIDIRCSGIDITELFSSTISNIRVFNEDGKKVYYKGILMKPLWQLLNYASESLEYHYILTNLLDENISDISKFNDKDFITHLNSKPTPFLDIDISSQILIPKTRSEEQYLADIMPMLDKRINEIKNDYKNII